MLRYFALLALAIPLLGQYGPCEVGQLCSAIRYADGTITFGAMPPTFQPWLSIRNYRPGDAVLYSNNIYYAKEINSGEKPDISDKWIKMIIPSSAPPPNPLSNIKLLACDSNLAMAEVSDASGNVLGCLKVVLKGTSPTASNGSQPCKTDPDSVELFAKTSDGCLPTILVSGDKILTAGGTRLDLVDVPRLSAQGEIKEDSLGLPIMVSRGMLRDKNLEIPNIWWLSPKIAKGWNR